MNTVQRDKHVLWHPFTQHGLEAEFLPVMSAKGAWLALEEDGKALDAISSWWVNIHGHTHPVIVDAIHRQAQKLEHVIFAGFTHEPAIRLAEVLIEAVKARGTNLSRCFYSDNGSTAVEVALKMAFQFHKNRGVKTRTRFIALENAYHGDTLGAMAVSARGSYHQHFDELLPVIDFIPADDPQALVNLIHQHPDAYAALIIEPLVQAAGGMRMHSPAFLKEVATLCKEAGILLICDEIFTGFYRTGTCFAFEQAAIQPDLLCLSKGLTGGFLPLAVTLATEDMFAAFHDKAVVRAFLHGHSYTANPISCAAALASFELLQTSETQAQIKMISSKTKQCIQTLSRHSLVENARCVGTIGAVNLRGISSYFSGLVPELRRVALKKGVLLRPMGEVLYAVPPYCVTEAEIELIYDTILTIIEYVEAKECAVS